MTDDVELRSIHGVSDKTIKAGDTLSINIDNLYKEILQSVLHDGEFKSKHGEDQRLSYIQNAFGVPGVEQQSIIEKINANEAVKKYLNVEIMEAKNINSAKMNINSDMFIRFYLLSSNKKRETSIKCNTSNPIWNEQYSLNSSKNWNEETLCFELWNNQRKSEIQNIHSLYNIAKAGPIGSATVCLKTVPATGINLWLSLSKKDKLQRGDLHVNLRYSQQKDTNIAMDEYTFLLNKIARYEIKETMMSPYQWAEFYRDHAKSIIEIFASLSGLSTVQLNISKWITYCAIHKEQQICFSVFYNILNELEQNTSTVKLYNEYGSIIKRSAKYILPSYFMKIYVILSQKLNNDDDMLRLKHIFEVLHKIARLNLESEVTILDLDEIKLFDIKDTKLIYGVYEFINVIVKRVAIVWFNKIIEDNCVSFNNALDHINFWINVVKQSIEDITFAKEQYDNLFQKSNNFLSTIYEVFEYRMHELITPTLKQRFEDFSISNSNPPIGTIKSNNTDEETENNKNKFKTLQLYMSLQEFSKMEYESKIKFHVHFLDEVPKWIKIMLEQCLERVKKIVDMDKLEPNYENDLHSHSVVDTILIFYQIMTTWKEIDWPELKVGFGFITKLLEAIMECCSCYGDELKIKMEKLILYDENFHVPIEWCRCVSNLQYLKDNMNKFYSDTGMDNIIENLKAETTDDAFNKIYGVFKNKSTLMIDKKIYNIVHCIATKIFDKLQIISTVNSDTIIEEEMYEYLNSNINIFKKNTAYKSESENILLRHICILLKDFIDKNKKKIPRYLQKIMGLINVIQEFNHDNDNVIFDSDIDEKILSIKSTMDLHAYNTTDLIHEYYMSRWKEQDVLKDSTIGELIVRINICNALLTIEVLNGNFSSIESPKYKINPFVKLQLYPEDAYIKNTKSIQTNVHNNSFCPLYEEVFKIELIPEKIQSDDAMILFNVKSKNVLNNEFIGEAFLPLSEVMKINDDTQYLTNYLKLTKPTKNNMIKILTKRNDKEAKAFVKSVKRKIT